MEEHLYIVIWKHPNGKWHYQPNGVFTERRLAENLIECLKDSGETWQFGIVEGPITNPAQMAEQKTTLGVF